eukprot:gene3449-13507_t
MAVFEQGYKDDMTKEEAMDLVCRAIKSGIYNDLGSGSNVDLCIITADGKEYLRNYEYLMDKTYTRTHPVKYAPGTTGVIKEKIVTISRAIVVADATEEEMDTS